MTKSEMFHLWLTELTPEKEIMLSKLEAQSRFLSACFELGVKPEPKEIIKFNEAINAIKKSYVSSFQPT